MKKTRKKAPVEKTTKETKRKNEIDKENFEKVIRWCYAFNYSHNSTFEFRIKALVYPYPELVILNFLTL